MNKILTGEKKDLTAPKAAPTQTQTWTTGVTKAPAKVDFGGTKTADTPTYQSPGLGARKDTSSGNSYSPSVDRVDFGGSSDSWSRDIKAAAPTAANTPLGMIGGVRSDGKYWQGLDSSGKAHAANTGYKDYSQLFREYSFEQKDSSWVEVGERNGLPVYAAPDYARDKNGNYLSVSSDGAVDLARERGTLIPTRDEVKAFYGQAEHIRMPTFPDGGTGDPREAFTYTQTVDKILSTLDEGTPVVHGKEFYTDAPTMEVAEVAPSYTGLMTKSEPDPLPETGYNDWAMGFNSLRPTPETREVVDGLGVEVSFRMGPSTIGKPPQDTIDSVSRAAERTWGQGVQIVVTSGKRNNSRNHAHSAMDFEVYRPDGSLVRAHDSDAHDFAVNAAGEGIIEIGYGETWYNRKLGRTEAYMGGTAFHMGKTPAPNGSTAGRVWASGATMAGDRILAAISEYANRTPAEVQAGTTRQATREVTNPLSMLRGGVGGGTEIMSTKNNPTEEISGNMKVSDFPPHLARDPEFAREVERLSSRWNIPISEIYKTIKGETRNFGTTEVASSGATGLFQFMPTTAKELGTSTAAIKRMTAAEQVRLYDKYLERWNYQEGIPLAIMQASPAYASKPDNFVVYRKGTAAWRQNPGWRPSSGGDITIGSIKAYYRNQ